MQYIQEQGKWLHLTICIEGGQHMDTGILIYNGTQRLTPASRCVVGYMICK